LFFAVWLTVVALPVLLIDNITRTDARAASVQAVSADAIDAIDPTTTVAAAPPSTVEVTTTVASEPPTTTTRPKSQASTSTSTSTTRPTTTTTEPPTTTAPVNRQSGGASWYAYNAGQCAHPSIPMGTVVTVTRLGTGASTSCVVTDRGPHGAGRIIDLDRGTFAQLADPGEGVIQVSITW